MTTPQQMASAVEVAFEEINRGAMAGLPIVNPMLSVEAVGFQEHQGRIIGVIITPWVMNLVVLPSDADDWSAVVAGAKQSFDFPSRSYDCIANEIDGIGTYFGFSLFSPMHEFEHQGHVVASAVAFAEVLMVESEGVEDVLDEDRLEKFLAGEDMETIKQQECAAKNPIVDGAATLPKDGPEAIDRRQLLRGAFTAPPTAV